MKNGAAVEIHKHSGFPQRLGKASQRTLGFPTFFTGPTAMKSTNENRTLHLLQKPDIFICYRQLDESTLEVGDFDIPKFLIEISNFESPNFQCGFVQFAEFSIV